MRIQLLAATMVALTLASPVAALGLIGVTVGIR